MLFKRIEIDARTTQIHILSWLTLTAAGACSLVLCLCPCPLEGTLGTAASGILLVLSPIPLFLWPVPQWSLFCSESQILDSYKVLQSLSWPAPLPWPLWPHSLPTPFPLPSTHSSSTTLVQVVAQTQQKNISSAASAQTFLITEGVLWPCREKSQHPSSESLPLTSKNLAPL